MIEALVLLAIATARIEPLVGRIEPLTTRIEDTRLRVTTVRGPKATVVEVSADVLFAFDSAVVRPRARPALQAVRKEVRNRCPMIVGHTDDRGSAAYNVALSLRRAEAVRSAIGTPCASVAGRGEAQPVASNEKAAGRASNRRVAVRAPNDPMG